MNKIIGLAGKGGTGKTTIASLVVKWLIDAKKTPVLAIDADPNATLAQNLGIDQGKGIVQLIDEFSRGKQNISVSVSKQEFLEYKIHELLNEAEGFDFLSMGRPEGPGCYCYINNVLRVVVEKLTKAYSYTVIDNEAGMEHFSRRTARTIDLLFLVSDGTPIGIKSAKRIRDLAQELDITVKKLYLIVNRARGHAEKIRDNIKDAGIKLIGVIPEDEELYKCSTEGKSITGLNNSSPAKKAIDGICKSLINGM